VAINISQKSFQPLLTQQSQHHLHTPKSFDTQRYLQPNKRMPDFKIHFFIYKKKNTAPIYIKKLIKVMKIQLILRNEARHKNKFKKITDKKEHKATDFIKS
jgi:hypothetical protein